MRHSHLNDMEMPETKRFIPKGFELDSALSQPIWSITARACAPLKAGKDVSNSDWPNMA